VSFIPVILQVLSGRAHLDVYWVYKLQVDAGVNR